MAKPDPAIHLIVSVAVIPSRLACFCATLDSLLKQSLAPDVIVVNLPLNIENRSGHLKIVEYESPLPEFLQHPKVVVYRTDVDVGSLNKVIPTLQLFQAKDGRLWTEDCKHAKHHLIVTVDDDCYYHKDLVSDLVSGWLAHPDHVIATEGLCFEHQECSLREKVNISVAAPKGFGLSARSYSSLGSRSSFAVSIDQYQNVDIPLGCGGVLYHIDYFKQNFSDVNYIESHIPEAMGADDYWIAGCMALQGIRIMHIPGRARFQINPYAAHNEGLHMSNAETRNIAVVQHFKALGIWNHVHEHC